MPNDALLTRMKPLRAFGRRLTDFRVEAAATPHGLLTAEEALLRAAARGEICDLGDARPALPTDANLIRAGFLRFLLLGGDDQAPVHERRIELRGACIDGDIDLDSLVITRPLWLARCRVRGRLTAHSANLGGLRLTGAHIDGISCHAAQIDGAVSLSDGFVSDGEVSFLGAHINGRFNCAGGVFRNPGGWAINCERADITGGVFLRRGFSAEGGVRFSRAEIGGQFNCVQSEMSNPSSLALSLAGARIAGSVYLSDGFSANGKVVLQGAEISGNLLCSDGRFRVHGPARWSGEDGPMFAEAALSLTGAKIRGELWFAPYRVNHGPARIEGSLDLQGARVGSLIDSPDSWPVADIKTSEHGELPCVTALDGFVYDRFAFGAPTRASARIRWLRRQRVSHLNGSFRPQPFEQLIKVLRAMGHDEDARRIAIFKQEQLTRIARGQKRLSGRIRPVYGALAGYGYRPDRLMAALFVLWLASAGLYWGAARTGGFAPVDAQVWTNDRLAAACKSNWTACPDVAESLDFNALTYSADVLLPVVNLGQRAAWTPSRLPIRAVVWAENILGSLGALLLGAILGGLIKKD
jgi:hypothetical protein